MSEVEPDYMAMHPGQMLEACGADGYAWATAFMQAKERNNWTIEDIDHGLMIGWFTNAIEAACKARYAKRHLSDPWIGRARIREFY